MVNRLTQITVPTLQAPGGGQHRSDACEGRTLLCRERVGKPLTGLQGFPRASSETCVSYEVRAAGLVFLSADRALASLALPCSRTPSIICSLDPQRAADSVTSW